MKFRGFTLIELLVYMGIFSILLVVLTEMLVSTLSLQLDSAATSSVDQDNRFIQQRLMYDIQRAKSSVVSADSQTLTLSISGTNFIYTTQNNNLVLNSQQLNSYDTSISNLIFQKIGAASSDINVNFSIQSNIIRPKGPEIRNVNTVIGLRPNSIAMGPTSTPVPTPTSGPTSTPTPVPTLIPTIAPSVTPTPANCDTYCDQRYGNGGSCQRSYRCNGHNVGNMLNCTGGNNNICCCNNVVPTNTPTLTPRPTNTPTSTPTPVPCSVTTSPSNLSLLINGTSTVNASVTSGLASATVNHMDFGSYDTKVATVNPTVDNSSPYRTTVTAVAPGSSAVWATATLSDGRICQSSGNNDTNITVTAPTPTPTPRPTNTPTPRPTNTPTPRPTNTPTPTPTPANCQQACQQNGYSNGNCRSNNCSNSAGNRGQYCSSNRYCCCN